MEYKKLRYPDSSIEEGLPIKVDAANEDGAGENIQDTYAKQDGYYQTLGAGKADVADNLTPYSEDSGVVQTQPFFNEGTGTGNGENIVDTGSYAIINKKKGNTIVYNQIGKNGTFVDTSSWHISSVNVNFSVSNNVATIISSVTGTENIYQETGVDAIIGHKYLVTYEAYTDVDGLRGGFGYGANYQPLAFTFTTQKKSYTSIFEAVGTSENASIYIYDPGTYYVSNFHLHDLTKWFNGNENIPSGLLSHPENFFRYYCGDLSYNAGTIIDSNGQIIKSIGRNVWDEEWESGDLATGSGQPIVASNYIRSKNYTEVIPSTTYYGYRSSGTLWAYYYDPAKNFIGYTVGGFASTFTTPSNCKYIKITHNVSTYNNDITISLYYEDESGYNQYYPYEVLSQIDTGSEPLYAAGEAYNIKEPSGLITRNIGSVDLGALDWSAASTTVSNKYRMQATLLDYAKGGPANTKTNAVCAKYEITTGDNTYSAIQGLSISINGQIVFIYDENYSTSSSAAALKTALSGIILYYELASPTTEQGTPFSENLNINDFGSILVETPSGTTFNGVPMGNEIFYPVDYKAFIDTLYNRVDGDAGEIVLADELETALENKVEITSSADQIYGTDENGNQVTYDKDSFGQVDDVKVNGTSVVTNKVANIDLSNYYNKTEVDNTFVAQTTTIAGNTLDSNISAGTLLGSLFTIEEV